MHQPVAQETSIKIFRMVTGEDIIGTASKIDDLGQYTIDRPFRIGYSLDSSGTRMGVVVYPWVFKEIYSDSQLVIKDRDIILIGNPSNMIAQEYKKALARDFSDEGPKLLSEEATSRSRNREMMLDDNALDIDGLIEEDYDDDYQEILLPGNVPKKATLH